MGLLQWQTYVQLFTVIGRITSFMLSHHYKEHFTGCGAAADVSCDCVVVVDDDVMTTTMTVGQANIQHSKLGT